MIIKTLLERKFLAILALLYTGLITWASLARIIINPINFNIKGSDKIAHFLAYFIFTLVWFMFWFFSKKSTTKFSKHLVKASVICFCYGLLMEVLQGLLTTYRSSEWFDVLANTSGIIFAVIILKLIENKLIIIRERL